MSKKNKPQEEVEVVVEENVTEEKVVMAKRIARQSEKFQKRTHAIGNAVARVFRWLSDWFDRILFSSRHSKMVAFGIAVLIFLAFNSSGTTTTATNYSKQFYDIPVVVNYNSELYEISGVPETVNVYIFGDYTDISMAESQTDYQVTLDLSGLTEGTHSVKFAVQGFSNRVKTIVDPDSATVDIKKKQTKTMQLGYDYTNQDKLGSQYVLGTPEFASNEVTVSASSDTLNKVAFVKALIDVSGQTSTFTTEAPIVAYDQSGNKLSDVAIIPNKVEVTVEVSSPSKSVSLVPVIVGEIPDGKAIASITATDDSIVIYGQQDVLDKTNSINVPIDAAALTQDNTKQLMDIVLPSGIKSANINAVTYDIKLGVGVSKTVDNIKLNFKNNESPGYKLDYKPEDTTTSVVLFGTQEQIDSIDTKNIQGYIDLRDVEPGQNVEMTIHFDPINPLVSIKSVKESIIINVIE